MKKIQISDHFSALTILLFSLPSIGMQLVDNTYQMADGYFISNYIGASAFAAENLIFPPMLVTAGVGLMFGSGAAALISYALGEGDREMANQYLSLTVAALAALGTLISLLFFFLMPVIASAVGAPEELIPQCVEYGRILALCMPFQILNSAFYPLLITAGRPGLGFLVSVVNASVNIVFDWFTVAVLGWGLTGAALATGLAWFVSAAIPLAYFSSPHRGFPTDREHPLHFAPLRWNGKYLLQTGYNGSSEMADSISYALIAMLFNGQLIRFAGEAGVDAYAVSEYVDGIFTAIFFGIAMSITPVVGYHLGEKNREELRSIWRNGFLVTGALGLGMAAISYAFAPQIARIFVGYDQELTAMSVEAMRIIAFSYILSGATTFSSAFFTGMEDGTASLLVAAAKSFVLPLIGLLTLPPFFGQMGIWAVMPVAEIAALGLVIFFFARYRKQGKL